MARVLIAEDDADLREILSLVASSRGHDVIGARGGPEAIDVGVKFHPDVLVTDWMLTDSVHGLHVSGVLHTLNASVRTILVTGFPAEDIRDRLRCSDVYALLQKPVDLDSFARVLERAAAEASKSEPWLRVPVLIVDRDWNVLHANGEAGRLLERHRNIGTARLDEALGPGSLEALEESAVRWVAVSPRREGAGTWTLRSRTVPGHSDRVVVVLPEESDEHQRHLYVQMLLGEFETAREWPREGRVLIVDDDELSRRLAVEELEQLGCLCHVADTVGAAAHVLEQDRHVGTVVVSLDLPGGEAAAFILEAAATQPDLDLVATSRSDRSREASAMGAPLFLRKPWQAVDLIDRLTGRLGPCPACGLRLPLRTARHTERVRRWRCGRCGARFMAVFDEAAPESIRAHAALDESPLLGGSR